MMNKIRRTDAALWIPLALFAGFLVLRIPFRAEFLISWDAVNFALGTHLFSLEHHQPHPPGYIGYIALGWLLNHITGDANESLTLLSIITGSAAPAAFFLLASMFMARRQAVMSAILFGLSPVVWYYSEVALTYSVELALALFFIWAGYKARQESSTPLLIAATLLLVLLGAIRQSGALFLMPLWLYMVWAFPWRQRLQTGVILVGGNLAWLLPLIWLSGGIMPYIRASAGLASLAVMPTSVFAMNPLGMGQNIAFILAGIVVGVNLGLLIIAFGFYRGGNLFKVFARHRTLFMLWLIPALTTYLLLHTGQLGYVLLILPAIFLLMGPALASITSQRSRHTFRNMATAGSHLFTPRYAVISIVALLALGNAATFLFAPQMVYAFAKSEEPNVAHELTLELFETLPLFKIAAEEDEVEMANRARQYNLDLNDAHWNSMIKFVKSIPPEETAILTVADGAGSFRHFTYYLPKYRVYGLGRDKNDAFGHLFTAYNGTSDYSVEGLEKAGKELQLPTNVRWLVVPRKEIYQRIQGMYLHETTLKSGAKVAVISVPKATTLVFEDMTKTSTKIFVERRSEGSEDALQRHTPHNSTADAGHMIP